MSSLILSLPPQNTCPFKQLWAQLGSSLFNILSFVVMEELKRIVKFNGNDGEDFLLCSIRTKEVLEDKECVDVAETDLIRDQSFSNL